MSTAVESPPRPPGTRASPVTHRRWRRPVAVTAIIPVKHCHEPYLRAALHSLAAQTSPDWRGLIVVEPADRRGFAGPVRGLLGGEASLAALLCSDQDREVTPATFAVTSVSL